MDTGRFLNDRQVDMATWRLVRVCFPALYSPIQLCLDTTIPKFLFKCQSVSKWLVYACFIIWLFGKIKFFPNSMFGFRSSTVLDEKNKRRCSRARSAFHHKRRRTRPVQRAVYHFPGRTLSYSKSKSTIKSRGG